MTGKEFRKWRRSEDIVQDEIAKYCGINTSTLSRWEHETIVIHEKTYKKLMEYIDEHN